MTKTTLSAKKLSIVAILIGGIIITVLVAILLNSNQQVQTGSKNGKIGGNFTLTSDTGPVSLTDYNDKVVVVYFGFTSCKMVCPTSMKIISDSLNQLSPINMASVQAILITTDPERDSAKKLAQFTSTYHPNIIGLTGSSAELNQVAEQFSASFEQTESKESDEDYGFYHSSRYYVIDRNGNLRDAMRHSTTANELTARIETLL
jgi:protein SCO1/2